LKRIWCRDGLMICLFCMIGTHIVKVTWLMIFLWT